MNEMKLIRLLTLEERAANKARSITELESFRTCIRPIKNLAHLIRTIEENAFYLSDMLLEQEATDQHSPALQVTFNETMDILDYLKLYNNPLTDT